MIRRHLITIKLREPTPRDGHTFKLYLEPSDASKFIQARTTALTLASTHTSTHARTRANTPVARRVNLVAMMQLHCEHQLLGAFVGWPVGGSV